MSLTMHLSVGETSWALGQQITRIYQILELYPNQGILAAISRVSAQSYHTSAGDLGCVSFVLSDSSYVLWTYLERFTYVFSIYACVLQTVDRRRSHPAKN